MPAIVTDTEMHIAPADILVWALAHGLPLPFSVGPGDTPDACAKVGFGFPIMFFKDAKGNILVANQTADTVVFHHGGDQKRVSAGGSYTLLLDGVATRADAPAQAEG